MTQRINGLTIILDKEYRNDDVQHIIEALKMIKGVQQVNMMPVEACCHIKVMSAEHQIKRQLYKVIDNLSLEVE